MAAIEHRMTRGSKSITVDHSTEEKMEGACQTKQEPYTEVVEKKLIESEKRVDQAVESIVKISTFLVAPTCAKNTSLDEQPRSGWFPDLIARLERLNAKLGTINRLQHEVELGVINKVFEQRKG